MRLDIRECGIEDIDVMQDMVQCRTVDAWLDGIVRRRTRYVPLMLSVTLPGKKGTRELIRCGHRHPDVDKILREVRRVHGPYLRIPNENLCVFVDPNESEVRVGICNEAERP